MEFIQDAGMAAIAGPQDDVLEMINTYKNRRDILVNGLNDIKGITCLCPEGAFYAFANIKETGRTSSEIAKFLLEEGGVAVLPGTDFGACGEGYIRLCYANSEKNIIEGLKRTKKTIEGSSVAHTLNNTKDVTVQVKNAHNRLYR
jgi:aspartate/methionine/tyrosine aminotransferase